MYDDIKKEEEFAELLKKEQHYYEKIREFITMEHEILSSQGSLEQLTSLMKQKQIILSCIDEIEHNVAPLKAYWNKKEDFSSDCSQVIKESIDSLDLLMKEILVMDQSNQEMFANYIAIIKTQLAHQTV